MLLLPNEYYLLVFESINMGNSRLLIKNDILGVGIRHINHKNSKET
jgi:hypothetical protein